MTLPPPSFPSPLLATTDPPLFPLKTRGSPEKKKSATPPPPALAIHNDWCPNGLMTSQKHVFFSWGPLVYSRLSFIFFNHFRLAAHYNLKNLKHNFCVHPNGGWPGEGVHLNYWPGCDEERLKLNFFKLGKTLTERIVRRFLDSVRMIDKQTQFDSQSVFHIRKILNSDDFRRSCRCTIGLSSSGEKNLFAYW